VHFPTLKTRCATHWLAASLLAIAAIAFTSGFQTAPLPVQTITIDGHGAGRVFDGIGALSAGASSRLLVDYREPYRSQILDYLFKPDYGAALQHLKVEIGADVNSTDGSEPSFARTRAEMAHPDFNRGYEWWLMEEAVRRNPQIILDSLAWGAPGWIGDGNYFSQDMANYEATFIEGAASHHLHMAYTGIWNERPYEEAYVKLLAATLRKDHLTTRIVCCDLTGGEHRWLRVAHDVDTDPEFSRAASVIGVHAPDVMKPDPTAEAAKQTGKTLWASEDEFFYYTQDLSRAWSPLAESLAMIYNLNYIKDRITTTEIWSPITSYYDNLAAPDSGLMLANTPWSGHYVVSPTIWVTAHTTQFAQPGWRYINSACGTLRKGGSFVTLKSPSGNAYSIVIETVNAKTPQRVHFRIRGGLPETPVHVWETNARKTFEHVADITPHGASFDITLDPDSVYSLTTTTGQHRGTAMPPPSAPFPFPYAENLNDVKLGGSPRYFADQDGAFEVHPCTGRSGRCLDQVITRVPIPWGPLPKPYTYLGSEQWRHYALSADFRIEGAGRATLLGRIDDADVFKDGSAPYPSCYVLAVSQDGLWELMTSRYKMPTLTLASGDSHFTPNRWHHFLLRFHGSSIEAAIDGSVVAHISDSTHAHGMAGIGTGWNRAEFHNFSVAR
jgi:hypothetical protein